jgi:8-hydroxy-5-deazaflavin:NADPH oxidoreductase
MRIAIIGSGDMGGALATAFSRRSQHHVAVRGAAPGSASALRLVRSLGIPEASRDDALSADALFLVIPWPAIAAATKEFQDYRGVLVSVVVPWDANGPVFPIDKSAAERIAGSIPAARTVCAFTTVSSSVILQPGATHKTSVIACSDHPSARETVMQLADDIGFEPRNGGSLKSARYAESMGLLWAALAFDAGYGERVGFRVHIAD